MNQMDDEKSEQFQQAEKTEEFLDENLINTLQQVVSSEFPVQDQFIERGVLSFQIEKIPNFKQAFLRLLEKLKPLGFSPFLRESNGRIILRVLKNPERKPSNILINLVLFIATIFTTFISGYLLSLGLVDYGLEEPLIGAATFTISLMAILGIHEMGHKIAANIHGIEATPPYFIPGPPLLGTFGAVILQKSLPPNKDSLFDVGVSGPILGFIVAIIATAVGLLLSPAIPEEQVPPGTIPIPVPLTYIAIRYFLSLAGLLQIEAGKVILLHPIAFAGWIGMVVTMLNLLPVGSLDGGHIARSLFGEKARFAFLIISILVLSLNLNFFWPMIIILLLFSTYRHPGALDDVSKLSASRKIVAVIVIVIFVASIPINMEILEEILGLFRGLL